MADLVLFALFVAVAVAIVVSLIVGPKGGQHR
jgi:hypothetical protein